MHTTVSSDEQIELAATARLAALDALYLLDAAPEPMFDQVAQVASMLCCAPRRSR